MKRILVAALASLGLFAAPSAHASFLAGYLAQCTATTSTTCTENTATSYARQPIQFSDLQGGGVIRTANPYSFGVYGVGSIAGHAVYDAATSGRLLMIIPLAAAVTVPPVDQADAGALQVLVTNAATAPPDAFAASYAAGATIGTTPDGSTVTAGSLLSTVRGRASYGCQTISGSGAAAVAAPVCTLYLRTDGGTTTTLYVKESGTSTSGWVAK